MEGSDLEVGDDDCVYMRTYDFLRLGRSLERADMTTRILDVRSANLIPQQGDDLNPFENIQWMSVLNSLTAYQMYRQQVRLRVRGPDVLRFLLKDPLFPRSIYHCLLAMEECLAGLPGNTDSLENLSRLKETVITAPVHDLADHGMHPTTAGQTQTGQSQIQTQSVEPSLLAHQNLHTFIDDLQIGLSQLHEQIAATYFTH